MQPKLPNTICCILKCQKVLLKDILYNADKSVQFQARFSSKLTIGLNDNELIFRLRVGVERSKIIRFITATNLPHSEQIDHNCVKLEKVHEEG